MPDLREALREATLRLAAAGVPSPRHDAEALAAHALGVERGELWRHDTAPEELEALVVRRESREPLQHITGTAYFRHLELRVGAGVFIPRPETEVLAGWAVERASQRPDPLVVDLCTGSGAIALSVAQEVRDAVVHGVELSGEALAWARRNVEESGLAGRVTLHEGDATCADVLLAPLLGQVDVVVSNPPYIPGGAVIRDPEVSAHDPALALWSGQDGLDAMRGIVRAASRLLRPGGWLGVEHADAQGEAVPALVRAAGGWGDVIDHPDLAGRPRFITARLGVHERPAST